LKKAKKKGTTEKKRVSELPTGENIVTISLRSGEEKKNVKGKVVETKRGKCFIARDPNGRGSNKLSFGPGTLVS